MMRNNEFSLLPLNVVNIFSHRIAFYGEQRAGKQRAAGELWRREAGV